METERTHDFQPKRAPRGHQSVSVDPLHRAAGTESLDAIRTVRISPIDANRRYSAPTLDEKLCGNELAHFGGFQTVVARQ